MVAPKIVSADITEVSIPTGVRVWPLLYSITAMLAEHLPHFLPSSLPVAQNQSLAQSHRQPKIAKTLLKVQYKNFIITRHWNL